jgi:hypothetical protein
MSPLENPNPFDYEAFRAELVPIIVDDITSGEPSEWNYSRISELALRPIQDGYSVPKVLRSLEDAFAIALSSFEPDEGYQPNQIAAFSRAVELCKRDIIVEWGHEPSKVESDSLSAEIEKLQDHNAGVTMRILESIGTTQVFKAFLDHCHIERPAEIRNIDYQAMAFGLIKLKIDAGEDGGRIYYRLKSSEVYAVNLTDGQFPVLEIVMPQSTYANFANPQQ